MRELTFHIAVRISRLLRPTQPNSIDDRGVIEFIRENRIFRSQHRLEDAGVGVKAGRIQDCILALVKFRQLSFQLFVNVLRSADEPNRAQPGTVLVQRLFGKTDHLAVGLELLQEYLRFFYSKCDKQSTHS